MITKYGPRLHPFIIDLGDELHGTGERVVEDVKAYQAVYDEAKKTDPSIMVLGTSIGANEEFFAAGMGKYCDAYDFHCYADAHNVALSLQEYQKLFQKYGNPRSVWLTLLGLNRQGVSRHAVAVDMVKKFAMFFAKGGACLSWFDLLYPQKRTELAGGSAEAHDVFDSRYHRFAPKLTAVIYYDLINRGVHRRAEGEGQDHARRRARRGRLEKRQWRTSTSCGSSSPSTRPTCSGRAWLTSPARRGSCGMTRTSASGWK
jgi:hypothetical protein